MRRTEAGVLLITLEDGRTREIRDAAAEQMERLHDAASYAAIAASSDGRYVVLHRQFYEGEASSLLDRRTGEEIKLPGYPLFSPDGQWMAAVGVDLAAEFSPNVLRIYRMTPAGPVLERDFTPLRWGPVDAVWTSPTTLHYLHGTYECHTAHGTVPTGCERKALRLDGSRWILAPETSPAPQ